MDVRARASINAQIPTLSQIKRFYAATALSQSERRNIAVESTDR